MKKRYINNIFIILGVIVVVLLIVRANVNNTSLGRLADDHTLGTGQMCYLYEKQAPKEIRGDSEDAFDREYVELTINDDATVSGIHNILPFAKDNNTATFIGVSDGVFVNVIATAHAEGQTWQEQRVYKIEDNHLFVGYQPVYVPQYQNDSDIYMYEDIQKLTFETDEFFLSEIDCDSVNHTNVL
ncbi:hypothetical protein KC901_01490 [Patescibacteria group bacterium]|nr:hypothetical protein [Patescibacteria group bacterium]